MDELSKKRTEPGTRKDKVSLKLEEIVRILDRLQQVAGELRQLIEDYTADKDKR